MRSQPKLGPTYWCALCLASVFGCNTGDLLAVDAGLGHWRGLPLLLLMFAAVLVCEKRAKRPHDFFYWVAIVIVRTAATNLADLIVHDARVPYPFALALFSTVLLLIALSPARRAAGTPAPADGVFWFGMFAAGTLGTAAGDDVAFDGGLGLISASLITCLAAAGALAIREVPSLRVAVTFWVAVVAIRTAGTNLGDLLASRLTLEAGTALSGAALVGWLAMPKPNAKQAVVAS